ncbi:ATP-binding cassette domain-containing protein [Streptomyces sp. TG1A-8]|uniref:ABC transporter ATP-binding protein n=1 Tax=Streptomyces sp. TG1A-8 TaxID=3051385 RepID=UPI00265BAC90|nr:ATP-binding cassette domain-containing protein [Streptomyces sp. TG1A-8]MDO0924297.1 ATP-binding cassette domain-containing protein [Streptomyces sp. TG1A-8]
MPTDRKRAAQDVVVSLEDVDVRRHTSGRTILTDIGWTVRAGEHWALLGANGAGKTTLLRLLGALMHPTSGSVELLGCRLGRVDVRELRARIGHVTPAQRVPQDATAHTIVLTGHSGTVQPLWATYDGEVRQRAYELLAELGIEDLADRPYGVCSGGQRARVLIARALMAAPRLLLLDEPFNALDLPSREDLVEALQRLAATRPELSSVTVTHHLEELSPAVGHALLLREGRVLAGGPVGEVLTGERLTQCFGRPVTVVRHGGRWAAYSGRPPAPSSDTEGDTKGASGC